CGRSVSGRTPRGTDPSPSLAESGLLFCGAAPAAAVSTKRTSATERAIGPTSLSVGTPNTPSSGSNPCDGLRPTTPQLAAGRRTDPPLSVPSAPKHKPAATAVPEPLLEPIAAELVSQGFLGAGVRSSAAGRLQPNSLRFCLPTTTAPAARRFATTVASADGTQSARIREFAV